MSLGHSEPPPPVTQSLAPHVASPVPPPVRRASLVGAGLGALASIAVVAALASRVSTAVAIDPAEVGIRLDAARERFPEVTSVTPCDDATLPAHGAIPVVAFSTLSPTSGFVAADEELGVAPSTSPLSHDVRARVGREPLVAVLRTVGVTMPKIVAGRLEPGAYHGQLAVFDASTMQPLCHAPVDAFSSRAASKGVAARGDDAARDDLRDRLRIAREEARARLSTRLQLQY